MDPTPKLDKHVSQLEAMVSRLTMASKNLQWVETELAARDLLGLVSKILTRATTVRELQDEGVI